MKPTLYLFTGYPGAGKTTVAEWICQATGGRHIWADRERHRMFPNPTHSATESRLLYDYLNQETERTLQAGTCVIFDTNFNFRKDRDYLRSIADRAGAGAVLVWMTTGVDVARERALHNQHSERNGYLSNMGAAAFDHIAGRLEAPESDEHPIKLNGEHLTKQKVLKALGI